MNMQTESQRLENNKRLLKNYRIDDIEKPQIILRKLRDNTNHDMAQDDLFVISLDMTLPNEDLSKKLPEDFAWALSSLKMFRQSYKTMLAEQTERVHLEGIAKKDSYIVLQSAAPKTNTNANSDSYVGGCSIENGRPCITLINDKLTSTTFLHEAVHHSDLFLGDVRFSDLPIYQSIIMLIDAQISSSGKNNKTVQSLRKINQLYKPGQLYVEGLAWITEMPMADLYKEKNHLGQNLKILHADYTKALLEDKSTTVACFNFFKPSSQLKLLLQAYNRNGQQIGNNRKTILKQQQDFTNELLKFRREINGIDRNNLSNQKLPDGTAEFCEMCGFNSLTSAVIAYHNANVLFEQTKNNPSAILSSLQKLQNNIQPKDLNNPSAVSQNFLTELFYLQLAEYQQNGISAELSLAELPDSFMQKNADEIRQKLYSNMKKDISLLALAYTNGSLPQGYELAQASKTGQNPVQDYIKNQKNSKTV